MIWAVASGDLATVEAQLADDIEWGLMPYIKVLKGKDEVMLYKVAQCFVYHINSEGKIDIMRQYLDTQSIWAQLK